MASNVLPRKWRSLAASQKEKIMTKPASWLSRVFAAVAFAEEGEFDTARALLDDVREHDKNAPDPVRRRNLKA